MARAGELVIVQHGEAKCDVAGIVGGTIGDTGLTVAGRMQAARTAARMACELAVQPVCTVYTGSRPRMLQTGAIVASVLGAPLRKAAMFGGQRFGNGIDARPRSEVNSEGVSPSMLELDRVAAGRRPSAPSWSLVEHNASGCPSAFQDHASDLVNCTPAAGTDAVRVESRNAVEPYCVRTEVPG